MCEVLVVLSGGQDSATCAALAVERHGAANVAAVTFNYGQRHESEVLAADAVAAILGIEEHHVIDLSFIKKMANSALLTSDEQIDGNHPEKENLPASFVPGRNALFLTCAHMLAQKLGCKDIYTGVCQTDYSGYPDCRQDFIGKLEIALDTGSETFIRIVTPLMNKTKAETFGLAQSISDEVLQMIVHRTRTCYNGSEIENEWGYGCGECPACKLRAKGWEEWKESRQNKPQHIAKPVAVGRAKRGE